MRKVLAWIESHNYCLVLLYFFFYMAVFTLEETFIRSLRFFELHHRSRKTPEHAGFAKTNA